jgi:hypothetical protein
MAGFSEAGTQLVGNGEAHLLLRFAVADIDGVEI